MCKTVKDSVVKALRHDYERAVNGYVLALMDVWGLDVDDCWWVGNKVGRGNFCFGDCYAINLDEIIYCVEEGVTYNEYIEHIEYWEKCNEYNLPTLNLKSWHGGAPRFPQETFDRLSRLKKDLDDAIEEAKHNNLTGRK